MREVERPVHTLNTHIAALGTVSNSSDTSPSPSLSSCPCCSLPKYTNEHSLHSATTSASRVNLLHRRASLQPPMKKAIAAGTRDATRLSRPSSCCVRYRKSVVEPLAAAVGAWVRT